MNKLTKRQILFCHEYLKDFNASKAAIRAGYSEKSAGSIGAENLQKPEIQKEIERLSTLLFKTVGLSVSRIVSEIASIGFSTEASGSERLRALDSLLKYEISKPGNGQDSIKDSAPRILEALQKLKMTKN